MFLEQLVPPAGQEVRGFLQAVTLQGSPKEQSIREGDTDTARNICETAQRYQTFVINRNISSLCT